MQVKNGSQQRKSIKKENMQPAGWEKTFADGTLGQNIQNT